MYILCKYRKVELVGRYQSNCAYLDGFFRNGALKD